MDNLRTYNLSINNISGDTKIIMPFTTTIYPTGISEVVENQFVSDAVDVAVNQISDFEKTRFKYSKPLYQLLFKNTDDSNLTWRDLGFTNGDITNSRKKFTNSFFRISYYDSDVVTNRNFLFQTTIFARLEEEETPEIVDNRVVFNVVNEGIKAEGYNLYWFKGEVDPFKIVYADVTFNNAKTGRVTNFFSYKPDPLPTLIDIANLRYIRVSLFKDNVDNVYKHLFLDDADREIVQDPTFLGTTFNATIVNLYEIKTK